MPNVPKKFFPSTLSLLKVRFSERNMRLGLITGAAFNTVGMPIQLFINRGLPDIPRWPPCLSIFVSAAIFTLLVSGKFKGQTKLVSSLFVVNAVFISLALDIIYSHFTYFDQSLPFQACKMGAIVAGILRGRCWRLP